MDENKVEKQLAKVIAKEVEKELDKEFDEKKSPKGRKWAITKAGHRFDPNDSIKNSIRVKRYQNEIAIESTKDYTGYLNFGTRFFPAREIYPDDYFPKRWKSIEEDIDEVMFKVFEEIEQ